MPKTGPRTGKTGSGASLRPFWSGTISFGLVSVPVALYPANRSGGVPLRMLAPDGTPLRRRYVCPAEGRAIPSDEIVRGYEVGPGSFVTIEDDELERLAPEKSRDIDLRRFVPRDELDPRYFDRAYFLTPDGDSTKAYRLLAAAMESSDRAGIATFVMRGKEYLVALIAEEGILRAETLRFPGELRTPERVGLPDVVKPPAAKVRALTQAIAALTSKKLDTAPLEDATAERLRALAAEKRAAGEDVVETAEADAEEPAAAPDLMNVLKWSLRQAGGRKPAQRAARSSSKRSRRPPAEGSLAEQPKDELYRRAQELDLPGRSRMTKDELVAALEGAHKSA